jgi:hypothetical protein
MLPKTHNIQLPPEQYKHILKAYWKMWLRFPPEQHKYILKAYWKTENVAQVQRHLRNEFGTPPTQAAITRLCDQFVTKQCRVTQRADVRDVTVELQ